MYLDFFELKQYPFRLTPDPDFFYTSHAHSIARAYMDYAALHRDGSLLITGDVGAGKTILIRKFLSELSENVVVAKVFQTRLNDVQFLQLILTDFGLNPSNATKVKLIDMLNTFLVDAYANARDPILIVDEAQNLRKNVLEEIRLLSGLETPKEKVLQVILVGQPELNDLLDSPDMEQLAQRLPLRFHICALNEYETATYIAHRLRIARGEQTSIFHRETLPLIYKYTGGIPRRINTLCDRAMTCAFTDDVRTISARQISTAVEELRWIPYSERASQNKEKIKASNRQRIGGKNVDPSANETLRHIDTLLPAMKKISDRLRSIEGQLERIANILEKENRR
jgi:type II secretory pathway predicted ATPase ExeA